ncbi:hypothetical protein GS39_01325 [Escherichia coli]|uniref:Uncharacterized protein n=2 Tax=Traversvirus TaxID=1981157 RepID=Q7Y2G8_9CAUD|nr:hypothetical protein Stx1_p166 [Escherichia Stx1 converting phage]NP_859416.1 hypothetical protein Stx2II_p169 [Escherichia phage Stx2 II]EYV20187.1 hypothetical protein BX49_26800 [Escherichia coli O145:NM str. 2010C-3518]EYV61693.1 hypothetical protein BX36_14965 [Escherichia coli O157:H7 str. 2009EL2109]EZC79776.1 hypothetical protein BY88_04925 [Escherichia coli O157:H7 str. K5602]KFV35013.1 hypothetical protein GS39_01325 [Escherichia coli]BAB88013.1 hypothetical protein [Stx2 convert
MSSSLPELLISCSDDTMSLTGVTTPRRWLVRISVSALSLSLAALILSRSARSFGAVSARTSSVSNERSIDSIRAIFRSRACSALSILS